MNTDVIIPANECHPVADALKDSAIQSRMMAAARAWLGKSLVGMTLPARIAEAEAIAQEAARRAWQNRTKYDAARNVGNWLMGFVRNVVREFASRRASDPTGPPSNGLGLSDLAASRERPVADAIIDKLVAADLLSQLAPIDQTIFRLKYEEDLTCGEIGLRIGMQENAVRLRVFRATGFLKQLYGVSGEGQS